MGEGASSYAIPVSPSEQYAVTFRSGWWITVSECPTFENNYYSVIFLLPVLAALCESQQQQFELPTKYNEVFLFLFPIKDDLTKVHC